MANFKTHLNIAASVSIIAATTLCLAGVINLASTLWLIFLGSMGGLMPDIDSDHSRSISVVFTVVAIFASCAVGLQLYHSVSLTLLLINIAATFLAVRLAIKSIFMAYSVHRGCCHSITFAVLIGMGTVAILNSLNVSSSLCWLSGFFIFGGCFIHLLLDEIYSIDIHGKRIKSSFGSALKLLSFKNPYISTMQITAIILMLYFTPKLHLPSIIQLSHFRHALGI